MQQQPSKAEKRLRQARGPDDPVDCRSGDPGEDNVEQGHLWPEHRHVHASVLRELLIKPGQNRGVTLIGARIVGDFDLASDRLTVPFWLHGCWFDEQIVLGLTEAARISLNGSLLHGIEGQTLHTRGNLAMVGVICRRQVSLVGSEIGGTLALTHARLDGAGAEALLADHLQVHQDLLCSGAFTAHGSIRLRNANIEGLVDFNGARLEDSKRPALDAAGIRVGQTLACQGDEKTGRYFRAIGAVVLRDARIAGSVNFAGATLVTDERKTALSADRIEVGAGMRCRGGFSATGAIEAAGAHVHGQLDFSNASLRATPFALVADGAQIDADVFLRGSFSAHGGIRLPDTHIGGQLSLLNARLAAAPPTADPDTDQPSDSRALNLQGAHIARGLILRPTSSVGMIDLSGARTPTLSDEQTSWPDVGALRLQDFQYQELAYPLPPRQRLEWLSRNDHPTTPQIYDQLALAYRRTGDEEAARTVLIAKQRMRRERPGARALPARLWSRFLEITVGYGYRPARALIFLIVVLTLASTLFATVLRDDMIATSDSAHANGFRPFLYTLDLLLPVASLGQRDGWVATDIAGWVTAGLTITGWLLGLTLLAALTGVLNRD